MTDFVIAHGAWAGAWAWVRVVDALTAKGHRVHVPTLSGLGERSHLAMSGITLGTHVDDIVNEVLWKDLGPIVLVGHSYGGFVITGAAERIAPRVAAIVYVDALMPADGQSFADMAPDWDYSAPTMPPPPTSPGDYLDEADRAWVDAKATPHPTGCFTEKLRVTGAYERIARKHFVQATGWDGFGETARKLEATPGWVVHRIACGHDIAIDKPAELAALLEAA